MSRSSELIENQESHYNLGFDWILAVDLGAKDKSNPTCGLIVQSPD